MNKGEVLKKAIQKAVKNGYIPPIDIDNYAIENLEHSIRIKTYFSIIFSHSFAKVFWGKEDDNRSIAEKFNDYQANKTTSFKQPLWLYHLQQMVLEEDPIKYLEKFL